MDHITNSKLCKMFLEINPVLGHVPAVAAPRGKELDEREALLNGSLKVALAQVVNSLLLCNSFLNNLLLFGHEFTFQINSQAEIKRGLGYVLEPTSSLAPSLKPQVLMYSHIRSFTLAAWFRVIFYVRR